MLVLLAIAALFAPALVAGGLVRRPGVGAALDGFVLMAIAWLVLTDVVPEALARGQGPALAAFLVGVGGPWLAERLGLTGVAVHRAGVIVGHVALIIHAALDGVALAASATTPGGGALAAAVILHQLPVGLAVWANMRARLGPRAALLALAAMAVVTAVGAFGGGAVFAAAERALGDDVLLSCAEALSAGTLLHVVAHAPLPGAEGRPRLSGAGGLAALGFMALVEGLHVLSALTAASQAHDASVFGHGALAGVVEVARAVGPGVVLGMLITAGMATWRPGAGSALRRVPPALVAGAASAFGALAAAVVTLAAWSAGPRATGGGESSPPSTPRAALAVEVDRDAPGILLGLYVAGLALRLDGALWALLAALVLLFGSLPAAGRLFLAVVVMRAPILGPHAVAVAAGLLVAGAPRGEGGGPVVRAVVGACVAVAVALLTRFAPGLSSVPGAPGTLGTAGALAFGAMLCASLLRSGPRGWMPGASMHTDAHDHGHDHGHAAP